MNTGGLESNPGWPVPLDFGRGFRHTGIRFNRIARHGGDRLRPWAGRVSSDDQDWAGAEEKGVVAGAMVVADAAGFSAMASKDPACAAAGA